MVEANYRRAFKAAIARIYHGSGAIVGAGFLVSERYLLTCAHVVTAALGIARETVEMPTALVEFDFPLISPGQKVSAKVVFWQPVDEKQIGEDMAGLVLEAALPGGSEPVRLVRTEEFWNHPFQVFGFPSRRDDGIWAAGVLRDRLANGWVQMEDIKAQGQAVQPGFSGSPVWDEELQGVVGMAVAADKKRDETKTAFMIPVSAISARWAVLEKSVQEEQILIGDPKMTELQGLSTRQILFRHKELNNQIVIKSIEIETLNEKLLGITQDQKKVEPFTELSRSLERQKQSYLAELVPLRLEQEKLDIEMEGIARELKKRGHQIDS